MQSHTSIKKRLLAGEKLNGCWIEMFNPIASEIMAMSGYDTAFVDLEHGPGSLMDAISMMQAVERHHCEPIIRTSSSDTVDIKRVLDIGPAGIMIPNIRNPEEAKEVVRACRYGPEGIRGAAASLVRASRHGNDVEAYARFMEEDFLLIAQVECREAVDRIDEIVQTQGIDMILIGPSDLSASLGAINQFDRPVFIDTFEKIENSVLRNKKLLGTIPIPGWPADRLYKNGHSLVISGADSLLLKNAAMDDVTAMQQASKTQ
ncbi:MAG: 2,4-dihydroxyhept-2-ene-1,7-dioic acid aldolase [Gammaproteobacteria bacterium]|nr:2,4-dihydroxyhept-2-ene-1,7-dioic acid aldolase [Gammaproteobacteria bacterium]